MCYGNDRWLYNLSILLQCLLFSCQEEKNNERTGGYGERTDMLQRQESQDPEKQDQHEAAYVKELQSSLYTSSFLSSGLNSNQYSNASALPKTDTTQNQLLNLPVTCNWGPQNHTLKRANSMTFLPGSNYYESTSRKLNVTFIVTRNIVWNDNMYVTEKHLKWKDIIDFFSKKMFICGSHILLTTDKFCSENESSHTF